MDCARRGRWTWRRPRLPSDYPALALAWRETEQQLAALAALAPQAGLGEDPEKASAAWRRTRTPRGGCPGCTSWPTASAPSASPTLDEAAAPPFRGDYPPGPPNRGSIHGPPLSTRRARGRVDYARYRDDLDHIRMTDLNEDAEHGFALDEIAEESVPRLEHLRPTAPACPARGPGSPGHRRPAPLQARGSASRRRCAAASCRCAAARRGRGRAVRAEAVLGDVAPDGQPGCR